MPNPENRSPWFTVELDGVLLHVPMAEGKTFTLPMTVDGFHALIGEAVEKAALLKRPDIQKKVGIKAVELVVDWLANRKR